MKDYKLCTISLHINGDVSLMILLHEDGTINRMGNGSLDIDKNFFIGITKEPFFATLMQSITPEFEQYLGSTYDLPDKQGATCKLEITLSNGNTGTGMEFKYGFTSMGPPSAVANFVNNAVRLTDGWHREQLKITQKEKAATTLEDVVVKPAKKWYEFWK